MQDYFLVGIITTTHGLKGEVKVNVTSDDPNRFDTLDHVYFLEKGQYRLMEIENVRRGKNTPLLKFKGLDRIEDVQGLRGMEMYIERAEAGELEEDEYFLSDLYGCHVYLEDESELGIVTEVIRTGANDVLVVQRRGLKDALIPVIKDCVIAMDPAQERIVIRPLKGLLEE
ncbi:MAG: ribosome maturation factor RimM [Lachnospiraceae bacterium]|nr:ribosome maturation factor RimM [Candidatus Equihabitans merdae]